MASSAVADARRFIDSKREFDVEADCWLCARHRKYFSIDSASHYLCADCLADLQKKDVINLQVVRYEKLVDEVIIGIRCRDERKIILALNAATDVWGRLLDLPGQFVFRATMTILFADIIMQHEFEIEEATHQFSAGLRRHMKYRRTTTAEYRSMISKTIERCCPP
jgi:hypothetical protein